MNDTRILIEECLPVRACNVLNFLNIKYLDELQNKTASELMQCPSFGTKSLRDVRKTLAKYGYALKGDLLCESEEEKRMIQNLPHTIKRIQNSLSNLADEINKISFQLDALHCNIKPFEK